MKKLIFLIAIVCMLTACKDREHPKPDYITYYEINHVIEESESDTLYNDLIFKISNDSNGLHASIVNVDNSGYIGCVYSNVLIDNTEEIKILNENDSINSSKKWRTVGQKLNIDEFAGKGEKFIGYRDLSSPPLDKFYYGWIKVSLSADKKTLHIIDRAINETDGNLIFAGQME